MTRVGQSSLWIVVSACLTAWNVFAQTVSLELKNGDRVTGRILSETNNRVVLSNAWSAALTIPLPEIVKRTALALPTNAAGAVVAATNAPAKTNGVAMAKAVAA